MKTVIWLLGSTIFSRLNSLLSNSDGVASWLLTSTLNLVLAGTVSSDGWNLWSLMTSLYSGTSAAAAAPATRLKATSPATRTRFMDYALPLDDVEMIMVLI